MVRSRIVPQNSVLDFDPFDSNDQNTDQYWDIIPSTLQLQFKIKNENDIMDGLGDLSPLPSKYGSGIGNEDTNGLNYIKDVNHPVHFPSFFSLCCTHFSLCVIDD